MAIAVATVYARASVKRVLVGDFSPMMYSLIVEALSDHPDVTLIGSTASPADLDWRGVDVALIPAADAQDAEQVMALLWRSPGSRLVVIPSSGGDVVMYELFPRKRVLGDLCASTLIDAIYH